MRILGLMTSCIGVVPWAQFHSRGLQSLILQNWDKLQASLDQTIPIPAEARASLRWWVSSDNLSQASDWNLDPAVIITTDASAKGWGAHFEGGYVQGAWDVHEKASSSNFRELKAVWKSLRSLQTRLVAKHVRIFSDNMTTVSLIRHQGTTRNPPLQRLAGRILQWAEGTTKSLSAFHIRGAENSTADFLSRRKVDPGEWELHPEGQAKGKAASKDAIARWLRRAIQEAYKAKGIPPPEGLKAHSTRAVASSWAERAHASIEQICNAATWTSGHTFIKHYRLDFKHSQDASFGRKVLQAVIPP
ncbi:uncharacterized protein [Eleutherodactylus coqui]|uniref:uncharacterized protein n=1 Tax=Eleutherodactylus coqui TaxID=57060 RepID=UPI003462D015